MTFVPVMEAIRTQLEQLHLDKPKLPETPKVDKSLVWRTMCSLYIENMRLKERIKILTRHKNSDKSIPDWVY